MTVVGRVKFGCWDQIQVTAFSRFLALERTEDGVYLLGNDPHLYAWAGGTGPGLANITPWTFPG